MEFKRIINVKFCAVVILLIVLDTILFIRDNSELSKESKIYDKFVNLYDIHLSEASSSKEAALLAYQDYKELYSSEDMLQEDKDLIKAARIRFIADAEYVDAYSDNINEKIESANKQLKSSVFSNKRSYEYLNILKTRYDMRSIADKTVKVSNGIWLSQLLDYKYTGIIVFIVSVLVVYSFFSEQKNGIMCIIRTSRNGRALLFFKRIGILLFVCLSTSLIFHFLTAVLSLIMHGGINGITDSVICDSRLWMSGYGFNRIEYCLVLALLTGVCSFALSMVMWLCLSFFTNVNNGVVLFMMVYAFEYILYTNISAKSVLRVLKYVNIASFMDMNSIFSTYRNWGYSFVISDVFDTTYIVCIAIMAVVSGICCYRHIRKYSAGPKGMLDRLSEYIHILIMKIMSRMPLIVLEIYKILICQKFAIVIGVLLWLVSDMNVGQPVVYDTQMSYYKTFCDKAEGLSYNSELQSILQSFQLDYDEYASSINYEDKASVSTVNIRKNMLSYLYEQVEYVKKKNDSGIEAVILIPYEYIAAFGDEQKDNQLYMAMICMGATILLSATYISYEKKCGMLKFIVSGKKRRRWYDRKFLAIWLLIGIFVILAYGIYYYKLSQIYDIEKLNIGVQSLQLFGAVPINMSMGAFLLIDVLLKILSLCSLAVLISVMTYRLDYVYSVLSGMILLVPQLLHMIGITKLEQLSLCRYIAVLPMWNSVQYVMCYIVLSIVVLFSIVMYNWGLTANRLK